MKKDTEIKAGSLCYYTALSGETSIVIIIKIGTEPSNTNWDRVLFFKNGLAATYWVPKCWLKEIKC